MHPACPNKKPNHLQNSFLRRTQFWVRKTFSKLASLKRASLVLCVCFCCLGCFGLPIFSPGWVSSLDLPSLSVVPLVPSGPVSVLLVPPSRYLVVFATARLLSSLLLMATKASALCEFCPTPCNGCCSDALFWPEPVAFRRLQYLRLTRLLRHDRSPVPGNRSAASCLCMVLRRALYHYATRSPMLFRCSSLLH